MHLIIGILQICFARFLMLIYAGLHYDFVGRWIVRLACSAFLAGAGIDDAAVDVVEDLGDDGLRLLHGEAERGGKWSVAALMVKMMDQKQ